MDVMLKFNGNVAAVFAEGGFGGDFDLLLPSSKSIVPPAVSRRLLRRCL